MHATPHLPQAKVNQQTELVVREAMEEARRAGHSEEEVSGGRAGRQCVGVCVWG